MQFGLIFMQLEDDCIFDIYVFSVWLQIELYIFCYHLQEVLVVYSFWRRIITSVLKRRGKEVSYSESCGKSIMSRELTKLITEKNAHTTYLITDHFFN